MNKIQEILDLNKFVLLSNILSNSENLKLFNNYDMLVLKKRFNNAYELSTTENILRMETIALKSKEILQIIDDFVSVVQKGMCFEKRNIYEIIKISNLPDNKLNKIISSEKFILLGKYLGIVSRETKYISFDFLIIRALSNFLQKLNDKTVQNEYNLLKGAILQKMLSFSYQPEKKEKESNFLCWIDMILADTLDGVYSVSEFISLNKKILLLISNSTDTFWKIFYSTNTLLLQQNFSLNDTLRDFKRYLFSSIMSHYYASDLTVENVTELMIKTLAKSTYTKEDFYYLLDSIEILSHKSAEHKKHCLIFYEYLLYANDKLHFLNHRFIRQHFINALSGMIKSNNFIELKQTEINLLIMVFHSDVFYFLDKQVIFNHMVKNLADINRNNPNITRNCLYKYCDILDYILAHNDNIVYPDIINVIAREKSERQKIYKKFRLSLMLKKAQ